MVDDVPTLGDELDLRARVLGQPDLAVTQFEGVRGQLAVGGTEDENRDPSRCTAPLPIH